MKEDFQSIVVEPTRDVAYCDGIARQPDLYERMADDRTPGREALTLRNVVQWPNIVLKVLQGDKPVGLFLLLFVSRGTYEVHTMLTRECRGAQAIAAGRAMLAWMFETTACTRLVSLCPDWCKESRVFARALGGRFTGREENRFVRQGKPAGCVHVEMTREEWSKVQESKVQSRKEVLCR